MEHKILGEISSTFTVVFHILLIINIASNMGGYMSKDFRFSLQYRPIDKTDKLLISTLITNFDN